MTKALVKKIVEMAHKQDNYAPFSIYHYGHLYHIIPRIDSDGNRLFYTGCVDVSRHCDTDIRNTYIGEIAIDY